MKYSGLKNDRQRSSQSYCGNCTYCDFSDNGEYRVCRYAQSIVTQSDHWCSNWMPDNTAIAIATEPDPADDLIHRAEAWML